MRFIIGLFTRSQALLGNAYQGALLRKAGVSDPKIRSIGPELGWEGLRGDSRLHGNDGGRRNCQGF